MSALIGALRVTLSAETANFEAGMRRAQRTTQNSATAIQKSLGLIKAGLTGLASGLSIGLFARAISNSLEYAGSLAEVGQQLGVTARDLQVFRYAAGQVGVSQEELEIGLSKLTITLGKVAAGAKEPAKALNAIGISVDQLKGKDTGEAFRIIADGLQKVSDRSQRAAVEVALFGRAGSKLDNLLSGGSSAINELQLAAEKLGVVLSDEQIQHADQTADKLRALKTVLAANIAGAVADNSDAILGLANALVVLIRAISDSIKGWRILMEELKGVGSLATLDANGFRQHMNNAEAIRQGGIAYGVGSVTMKLPPARGPATKAPAGTSVGQFLATGGGGGGRSGRSDDAERKRQEALRKAYEFDQEQRRAEMDILRAQQDLASDYVQRTDIGLQILDAEKAAYAAELQYNVAAGDMTKAQADTLKAAYDKKDALQRQALLEDERAKRREEQNQLEQVNFDLERDRLQSEQQIATTAKEQRDVQLRLLDLSYRQERARLEAVLADEKASEAAKEEARRRLANLDKTYANDRQGVIQNTMGPLDQFFSQVPKNAAEAQEAMERLQVMGIDGAINSIMALTDGFKSFRDTAVQAIKQVIAELIRMQLMKLAMNIIGSAAGAPGGGGIGMGAMTPNIGSSSLVPSSFAIGHFAAGGSMILGGRGGTDRNLLSLNGLPIAKVSRGEAMHIVPDGKGMGGITVNAPITIQGNASRETLAQAGNKLRIAVADAARRGY